MLGYCDFKKDDIINFNRVREIWSKNTRPVSIYINNPFCMGGYDKRNCRYCVHRGYPSPDYREVRSFYKYFFKNLDKYIPIINKCDIKLVNFGGGTPTFIYAKYGIEKFREYLEAVSKRINGFKDIHKMMELHPAYLTEELLDLLKEYGFTTVMFCVQTFHEEILKNQNRLFGEPGKWIDKLKKLRYHAKDLGINIAFDFITFWNAKYTEDTDILDDDLKILKDFDPDEFTVSVMCQYKYGSGIDMEPLYDKLRHVIYKNFPDYINPENSLYIPEVTAIRMYNPNNKSVIEDFDLYRNSMTDVGWSYEHGISTLGLGCYRNRDKAVFSVIGPNYTIYEEFRGFEKEPKYHLAKNYDFWKAAHKVLEALEKEYDGEVPVGTKLELINICQNQNLAYSHFGQGNCDYNIFEPGELSGFGYSPNKRATGDIKKRVLAYGNENRKEQEKI